MNRQELLDGLDLHNDDVFDQEIDAVADLDTVSVEHNRPWALGLDAQPRERSTGTRQYRYALSNNPGRSAEWTLRAPRTISPVLSFIDEGEHGGSPSPPRHLPVTTRRGKGGFLRGTPCPPWFSFSEART
jgi:hypothetical protein